MVRCARGRGGRSQKQTFDVFHLRSFLVRLLRVFIHFVRHSTVSLGIPSSGVRPLPTQRRLWTVIKGPFVHKKAQENFVRLTRKRAITVLDTNPQVIEMYFSYLHAHALSGVGTRTVRWDRAPIGFGGKRREDAIKAGLGGGEQGAAWRAIQKQTLDTSEAHASPGRKVDNEHWTSDSAALNRNRPVSK